MKEEEFEVLEPGRELDALVVERVFGLRVHWRQDDVTDPYPVNERGTIVDHYSTDISAAWEVIDKMYEKEYECSLWMTDDYKNDECYKYTNATFFKAMDRDSTECEGKTTPEAICKAALLTLLKGNQ